MYEQIPSLGAVLDNIAPQAEVMHNLKLTSHRRISVTESSSALIFVNIREVSRQIFSKNGGKNSGESKIL